MFEDQLQFSTHWVDDFILWVQVHLFQDCFCHMSHSSITVSNQIIFTAKGLHVTDWLV